MNYKLSKPSFIIYLIILTLLMWTFGIHIGNVIIPLTLLFTYVLLGYLILYNPQYLKRRIFFAIRYLPFKYLGLFILWGILSYAVVGQDHSKIFIIIIRMIRDYGLFVIPISFAGLIIPNRYMSYRKLYDIFIISYFLVLIFGFFKYLIGRISPSLHLLLHSFITTNITADDQLGRASSVFSEPSFFATFLFVTMPIIFNIVTSKFMILKSRHYSKLFKLLLVTLLYVNLFLTQSPIYIIAGLVYTIIYFRKLIFQFSVKNLVFMFLGFVVLYLVGYFMLDTYQNNKIITRILKTINSINSISDLIKDEPSLGTRLSLIINTIDISKKHPIIGYGYANTKKVMYIQLKSSNVPITYEIAVQNEQIGGLTVASLFFQHLSWVGIPGTLLLYLFFISTLQKANKSRKYFVGKDNIFISGLVLAGLNYLICSIYWLLITDTSFWFYYGLLNSVILNGMSIKRCILLSNAQKTKTEVITG